MTNGNVKQQGFLPQILVPTIIGLGVLIGWRYLINQGNRGASAAGSRVGQIAPEISGQDIAGVAFKLSDYRGKVVVLDFWGDW